ncbi:MAG: tRNA lysidine(34) synthetase TilS [Kiritimatiellia bacterium]
MNARDRFIEKIHKAIVAERLFAQGDHVLVGVSGGADSVALLLALHALVPRLGLRLTVAHLDHGLRGQKAREDAGFVRHLAERLGLPCVISRARVRETARRYGISIEMAARKSRYLFFFSSARRVGANVLTTAHTADDQAETLLLHLCRGAGLRGLGGIKPTSHWNRLRVVRPMLGVSRQEVLAFLRRNRVEWREDETNLDLTILRNCVRHEILPLLESKLNPRIREVLARTAAVVREEDEWLEEYCRNLMRECTGLSPRRGQLLLPKLRDLALGLRRRILRLWLATCGVPVEPIDFDTIERLERLVGKKAGTGRVQLAGNWTVSRQYDRLVLTLSDRLKSARPFRAMVAVPGETLLAFPALRITVRITAGITRDTAEQPGQLPACASLSLSRLRHRRLYVRSWRPGDRMRPLGCVGSKKLQDIFVDEKVPREERALVPIFECGKEIVWVPGYRVAQGWEIKDSLEQAVQIQVEQR